MLKMTKCGARRSLPLSFLLIRSSENNLKTPSLQSFLVHEHSTRRIQSEGAKSAVLPVMIVEDYQQTGRTEVSQITSFPVSEAYTKLPEVTQIVSIGKLSLQSSVCLLISPTEMSVVLFCQSICAHGDIEKPIICYHLIHAYNGV